MPEGDRVLFTSKEVGLVVEAVPNEIHVGPTQVLLFGICDADFENWIWCPACFALIGGETSTEHAGNFRIMSQLIDSLGMNYAVIEALRTETAPERFVIAYREEESLRDLIAAGSIIAVGFVSREEAEATIEARVFAAAASMQMPAEAVVNGADSAARSAAITQCSSSALA